jgi:hypothetical protein
MIHSTTDLPPSDLTRVGPIPTTAPIRTIIDAAGHLPPDRVADLVDRALLRGLVHPVSLDRRARDLEAPARPGAARVMRSLATVHPDLQMARNEWEARVLRLCARFDLPLPTPNLEIHVGGRRRYLDVAWQPSMVLLEFDGYMPHMESRRVFAEDRLRQNDLVSAGWLVFRVTSTMLTPRHFRPIAEAVSHRHQLHRTAV